MTTLFSNSSGASHHEQKDGLFSCDAEGLLQIRAALEYFIPELSSTDLEIWEGKGGKQE